MESQPKTGMHDRPKKKKDKTMGLTGPIIFASHWNMLSPVGPALHNDEGGSRPMSSNS